MKTNYLILSCVMLLTGLALHAQPTHAYELNNSYADTYGGSAMTPNGGTLTATSYLFEMGEGPNVSNVIDPNTYSIVMRFTPHYIDSWAKVLDFKNRTVDGGVYISGPDFYFSNSDYSISGGASSVFTQDVPVTVCITRDGVTKEVRGYADGILHWSFVDANDEASFTGPGNIIQILIDDTGVEHSNGSLDYFRVYDYVVTDPNIINPPSGNSDSDCDGIINDFDICTGGDDNGPCNATTLPPLSILPTNWLCSNNNNSEKILICHQGSTLCVSENAANTHLAHGDFLGPCTSCPQNFSAPINHDPFQVQAGLAFELNPNPAVDQVNVRLYGDYKGEGQIKIYDPFGKELFTRQLNPEENIIQLYLDESRFSYGIYYVVLVADGEIQTKRFLVAR